MKAAAKAKNTKSGGRKTAKTSRVGPKATKPASVKPKSKRSKITTAAMVAGGMATTAAAVAVGRAVMNAAHKSRTPRTTPAPKGSSRAK